MIILMLKMRELMSRPTIQKNSSGFTIVELIVVLVVIALLIALTLPTIFSLPKRARDTQRKKDLKDIQLVAEEVFVDNNGSYGPNGPLDLDFSQMSDFFDYMNEKRNVNVRDPKTNEYYGIIISPPDCPFDPGYCDSYTLFANLENCSDKEADNQCRYKVKSIPNPDETLE